PSSGAALGYGSPSAPPLNDRIFPAKPSAGMQVSAKTAPVPARGSCANLRFRLPSSPSIRLGFPTGAIRRTTCGGLLLTGVLADGDRHGQMVQCPKGLRVHPADERRP